MNIHTREARHKRFRKCHERHPKCHERHEYCCIITGSAKCHERTSKCNKKPVKCHERFADPVRRQAPRRNIKHKNLSHQTMWTFCFCMYCSYCSMTQCCCVFYFICCVFNKQIYLKKTKALHFILYLKLYKWKRFVCSFYFVTRYYFLFLTAARFSRYL